MHTYTKAFFLICLSLGLTACQKNSNTNDLPLSEYYELAIVDSVQVDILTSGLALVDVNDDNGNILAIQSRPPIAYVLNPKGKIIAKMDRPGQDPQAVGNLLLSGEFYEDGIALMGQMKLKTYDNEFILRKSLRPKYDQSGMIYMGFNHLFEFNGPNHKQLVAFFGGPQTDLRGRQEEYYNEFNLVDVVDPYLAGESIALEGTDRVVFGPVGGG
ncbi:MAG: hypothetical protein ACJAVN_002636 [Roseivirga sp.]|jgi:hypothetical protein